MFIFRQLGCKNELLTPFQMKQRFPWLNTDGIELGCLGLKDEGWYVLYNFNVIISIHNTILYSIK